MRSVVILLLVVMGVLIAAHVCVAAPGAQQAPSASPGAPTASPGVVGEPPVTTVTGADQLWHNHAVVLTFTATVASGSVTAIEVRVDGGEVLETPGATCQRTIEAPADHGGDGSHLVEFRAIDGDGDIEEWKSVTVKVDTRRPSTTLLHAVGVMRTCTAKIAYRVDDAPPSAGASDVTIVISSGDGHVVKTLKLRSPRTGADLVARFSCGLPFGFYRVRVQARDLAGNVATSVAQSRLVVTRWMRLHSFGAQMVGPDQLPYATGSPISRDDSGPHDAEGVRMYVSGGRLRNYPGGQARYGLANLNTYRLTGEAFYLDRAAAQAQRLIETHVSYREAWFYPQRYTRFRHAAVGDLMRNPWFSGMSQGQVISLMVGMYEATGKTKYLSAAKATLSGFLYTGPASRPWVANLDGAQRLWIQEWPKLPLDYTFNGHMIASFGLYDYYRVTKDTLALVLFRAAASAALDYAPKFRRPGQASVYCLLHRTPNLKYHRVHYICLRNLADFTGEAAFAHMADLFARDCAGPKNGPQSARSTDLLELLSGAEAQQDAP
jgi:D-glucuronyl C5-epimerase C-terminus